MRVNLPQSGGSVGGRVAGEANQKAEGQCRMPRAPVSFQLDWVCFGGVWLDGGQCRRPSFGDSRRGGCRRLPDWTSSQRKGVASQRSNGSRVMARRRAWRVRYSQPLRLFRFWWCSCFPRFRQAWVRGRRSSIVVFRPPPQGRTCAHSICCEAWARRHRRCRVPGTPSRGPTPKARKPRIELFLSPLHLLLVRCGGPHGAARQLGSWCCCDARAKRSG